jgi:hypothetical protein
MLFSTAESAAGLPSWALALIVFFGTVAVFLLIGLICFGAARRRLPGLQAELKKLDAYETGRGQRIEAALKNLEAHGYLFDAKTSALIAKGAEDISSLSLSERADYKSILDFTGVFLEKMHREDKRYGKFIAAEEAEAFKKYPEESDKEYQEYNRKAVTYNAFKNMVFTKIISFFRREKTPDAIVF